MKFGRTSIHVDAPNIFVGARYRIDWPLFERLVIGRGATVVRKMYYIGIGRDDTPRRLFLRWLKVRQGWEIVTKRSDFLPDNSRVSANLDEEIKFNIVSEVAKNEVDTVVLCSGDGGFTGVVDRIIQTGKRVIAVGWLNRMSSELTWTANETIFIDDPGVERAVRWRDHQSFRLETAYFDALAQRSGFGEAGTLTAHDELADSRRVNEPNRLCDSCQRLGVSFVHWGPLVAPPAIGRFCRSCWRAKVQEYAQRCSKMPLPESRGA